MKKKCCICGAKNDVNNILCSECNSMFSFDSMGVEETTICPRCKFKHQGDIEVCTICNFPIQLEKKAMSDVNKIYNEVFKDDLIECTYCGKMIDKNFPVCGYCDNVLDIYPTLELKAEYEIIVLVFTEPLRLFGKEFIKKESNFCEDLHCIFHRGTYNFFVQDLSNSGMSVNDIYLNKFELYSLELGDVICFGDVKYTVSNIYIGDKKNENK